MQVSYVNVFVENLQGAIEFYRDRLGLDLQFASPEHGFASFSAGPTRLALAKTGPEHIALIGRHTGVGFEVPDLSTEHDRLVAAGVAFVMPPTKQSWGGSMAMFTDPEGNVYYLNESAQRKHS